MDAPAAPLVSCDIAALLAAGGGGGGRAGAAHSVAAAALHRTPAGWGVTLLGAPLRGDDWGASLAAQRALLAALPGFPAGRLAAGAPRVQARPAGRPPLAGGMNMGGCAWGQISG